MVALTQLCCGRAAALAGQRRPCRRAFVDMDKRYEPGPAENAYWYAYGGPPYRSGTFDGGSYALHPAQGPHSLARGLWLSRIYIQKICGIPVHNLGNTCRRWLSLSLHASQADVHASLSIVFNVHTAGDFTALDVNASTSSVVLHLCMLSSLRP